ncbi:MAG TPA: MDR family MFS transporter [Candidatus Acidoferrales bacterium]|nr:MDR family MFS transporter [Candidatus Acidoferrales bacterium]
MTSQRDIAGALFGILLALLLGALDSTIVVPALPVMAVDFHGLDHLSWVVVAYLLTSTALTPIYGKLSDIYGRGRLIQVAIAAFTLASILCASAQTLPQMIVARALQGAGGGGLFVMAQAMIADFIPARERGRFQVYTATVWAVAAIAGPPIGGWFVDHLSWRWVFWINLPLGLIALAFCRRAAARLRVEHHPTSIDYIGALLLTLAVTGLLLVSTWGGITYPWLSPVVLGTLAVSVAIFAAFIAWELHVAEPLLPPRIYGNGVIGVTSALGFLTSVLMVGSIVLFPVFFELVMGFDAGNAGILLIPLQVGVTAASFAAGQIMRRTGRYKMLPPLSLAFGVAGALLLATMDATTSPVLTIFYSVLLGIGIGASFPVVVIVAQNAAEPRDLGVATSTVTFSRQLGGSFGAAVFWSIILGVMSGDLHGSGMDAARKALFSGGRAGLERLPANERDAIIGALVHGFHAAFVVAGGVALLAIAFSFLLKEEPLGTTSRGHVVPARRADA